MSRPTVEIYFDSNAPHKDTTRKVREHMECYFSQFGQSFARFGKIRFRIMLTETGTRHLALVELAPSLAPTITTSGIRITARIEGAFWATGFL